MRWPAFAVQCTQSRRREVGGSVTKPRELSHPKLAGLQRSPNEGDWPHSKLLSTIYKSSSKTLYFDLFAP
jgi:hypothetical protein